MREVDEGSVGRDREMYTDLRIPDGEWTRVGDGLWRVVDDLGGLCPHPIPFISKSNPA